MTIRCRQVVGVKSNVKCHQVRHRGDHQAGHRVRQPRDDGCLSDTFGNSKIIVLNWAASRELTENVGSITSEEDVGSITSIHCRNLLDATQRD